MPERAAVGMQMSANGGDQEGRRHEPTVTKAVVTTTIRLSTAVRLPFDYYSNALRPLDDLRCYPRPTCVCGGAAAALRPK